MIEWFSGEPPIEQRGCRLLLIGIPLGMPIAGAEPDIVIGHWHDGNWGYVPVQIPYDENIRARPSLKILWWAEIPKLPNGLELRELGDRDLSG
jgi:hypothetical protein